MKYFFFSFSLLWFVTVHGQPLSVMSYNIRCGHCDNNNSNNWDSRKDMLLAVIQKHNPEILGLQEAVDFQLKYLLSNLPEYHYFGTGRNADGTDEGCYILYKRDVVTIDSLHSGTKWFSSTPDVPGSNDMGDLYKRIVTFARFKMIQTNKKFYIFNTHLTYLDSLQVRYINFLSDIIKQRAVQDPFILTGDFNADEASLAMQQLHANFHTARLLDTFRDVYPKNELSTFNFFTGKKDGRKIDYIFIEADHFQTVNASCDTTQLNGKYPSDHNAMTAVIRIK